MRSRSAAGRTPPDGFQLRVELPLPVAAVGRVIRILLADDEHLIRGAIAALLGLEDDLDVVAQAATGAEALSLARALRPDVAVLDLQLPDLDGVTVASHPARRTARAAAR